MNVNAGGFSGQQHDQEDRGGHQDEAGQVQTAETFVENEDAGQDGRDGFERPENGGWHGPDAVDGGYREPCRYGGADDAQQEEVEQDVRVGNPGQVSPAGGHGKVEEG